MRKVDYEDYLDKIWGEWVGKCAGESSVRLLKVLNVLKYRTIRRTF